MGIKAFQPHLEGKYSVPNLGQSIALQQRSIIFSIVDHSVALKAIACDLTHRKIVLTSTANAPISEQIDRFNKLMLPGYDKSKSSSPLILAGDAASRVPTLAARTKLSSRVMLLSPERRTRAAMPPLQSQSTQNT
ncbi:hypothetical protein DPSP01_012769 [Paraphaeosphaeria sporulosa]